MHAWCQIKNRTDRSKLRRTRHAHHGRARSPFCAHTCSQSHGRHILDTYKGTHARLVNIVLFLAHSLFSFTYTLLRASACMAGPYVWAHRVKAYIHPCLQNAKRVGALLQAGCVVMCGRRLHYSSSSILFPVLLLEQKRPCHGTRRCPAKPLHTHNKQ